MAVIIRHNLQRYDLPISTAEIALCLYVMYVCQNTYVMQWNATLFQLQYFTDQSLYAHMSNSNENIAQWGLASEGYQFQCKLWERHELTLQPVITYVYLCSLRFKASILEEGRNWIEM